MSFAATSRRLILPDEVQIWRLPLTIGRNWLQHCMKGLSAEERRRAFAFRVDHARDSFVSCRWALRQLLSLMLERHPETLRFQISATGKPELEDGPGIEFNVSHSGGIGLIALSENGLVGIDVEEIRTVPEIKSLSRRFFSAAEANAIESRFGTEAMRAFFACWTRKEALVKALGVGIGAGMERFDVGVDPDAWGVELWHESFCPGNWRLRSFAFEGYLAAVAMEGTRVRRIRLSEWPKAETIGCLERGLQDALTRGVLWDV